MVFSLKKIMMRNLQKNTKFSLKLAKCMDKGKLPVFKVREFTHCITNSQELWIVQQ